ncbi:MAG TPA: zinc-binding alcohol dehydrogenase family protein [Candidatus Acidoferrum sp.]|nr:zinc-binding alcohol dehydrogenase family protein [Candidatus Acidoferrum sp.]
MKAAIINEAGKPPAYGDFREPLAQPGEELITVSAAALTHLTKARASGAHYSSDHVFPAIPGVEGVGTTQDGRRVYFALPAAPFGGLAEKTRARSTHCVPVPDAVDDVTAAAIANPGMSSWAALAERARLKPGETVLVNGATGIAGRLALQISKYLGAGKVIATGRDNEGLEELRVLGADVVIPFKPESLSAGDTKEYENALEGQFAIGVDVVLDYLWGKSAETVIIAAAKGGREDVPVRFIQIGEASGEDVRLPGAALRSSSTVLMGSGIKSVPLPALLAAVHNVFQAASAANLKVNTKIVPLADVETAWDADSGKSRIVFVVR